MVKKKKSGVEITIEEQSIKIYVPSFSTIIIVRPDEKKYFIKYLKYIHNKYNVKKTYYNTESKALYKEDRIYFGKCFSVKHPKFGNYLEIKKIPIILNLLKCDGFEDNSVTSIIKKIKKIRDKK